MLDTRPQRFRATVGVVLIALACALGAWVFFRGPSPFAIDVGEPALRVHAVSALLVFAIAMDAVGGHLTAVLVVPILGALALYLSRRRWSALYFLTASVGSALLVQVVKHTFGRARPEDILIVSDYGSFPRGIRRTRRRSRSSRPCFSRTSGCGSSVSPWVVLMAFSRTYLHAHWLSDTAGGALIGAGSRACGADPRRRSRDFARGMKTGSRCGGRARRMRGGGRVVGCRA